MKSKQRRASSTPKVGRFAHLGGADSQAGLVEWQKLQAARQAEAALIRAAKKAAAEVSAKTPVDQLAAAKSAKTKAALEVLRADLDSQNIRH